MFATPILRLPSERFVEEKNSDFYTTLTGRKQAGNMQSAVDLPKGIMMGWEKRFLLASPSCFSGPILETTIRILSEVCSIRTGIGQKRGKVNEKIEARQVAEIQRQSHF